MGKNENDDHDRHYGTSTTEKTNQDFNGRKPDPDKDPLGKSNESPYEDDQNSGNISSNKTNEENSNPEKPKPNGDPSEKINHQIGEDDQKEYKETEITSNNQVDPKGSPVDEDEDHIVDQDSNDNRDEMGNEDEHPDDKDNLKEETVLVQDPDERNDQEHPLDKGNYEDLGSDPGKDNDYRNGGYYKLSDFNFL